ncbi:hypothetical protein MPH_11091 [Macrophomina phaseolina MS6]|uniref:Uncharacterized protein n=1 Tax=Macrophomina phaseolina (strain MS6) TaxID=1126212 RepID=K2RAS3_MACPH|nr:hypothetical protein MPH_11091 [Macrophomina phaseolina MS6]
MLNPFAHTLASISVLIARSQTGLNSGRTVCFILYPDVPGYPSTLSLGVDSLPSDMGSSHEDRKDPTTYLEASKGIRLPKQSTQASAKSATIEPRQQMPTMPQLTAISMESEAKNLRGVQNYVRKRNATARFLPMACQKALSSTWAGEAGCW